jgi:hypothetical protein
MLPCFCCLGAFLLLVLFLSFFPLPLDVLPLGVRFLYLRLGVGDCFLPFGSNSSSLSVKY